MDPKQLAEFDQNVRAFADTVPPILWAMYQALLTKGFNDAQAFFLTNTYLKTVFRRPDGPAEGAE